MTSLIITAAGKASRFHDVGYDQPKYLLPWTNSKTILKNIIDELTLSGLFDNLLVIVNKREQFFETKIRSELPNQINSEILFVRDNSSLISSSARAIIEFSFLELLIVSIIGKCNLALQVRVKFCLLEV